MDPRINPYRPDLAAASLRGQVEAERFVEGVAHQVRAGRVTVRGEPSESARQTTELLFGEVFTVYETRDGWAWGQHAVDGYVGWTRAAALSPTVHAPTHRLHALRSFLFPEPDLKSHPLEAVSLGSPVAVARTLNGWSELASGGWIFAKHLRPLDARAGDPIDTALRFLGVPYLWGGRSSLGLDCSGLAQISLTMAGIPAPRDSDQQGEAAGTLISRDGTGVDYRRNDLVFFPGHVGLMLDATQLLHATAFTLSVCIEPLADVAARAGGILAVRRP